METVTSNLPLWACLCSLLAVPPIVIFGRIPNMREFFTFVAGFAKLALVLKMLPMVMEGKILECTLFQLSTNVALEFRVDALGILFALVASSLWIPTSLYSIGYMRGLKEHSQTRFVAFFAVSLFATLGVAFAGNLLTLYVFYEVLSLATFPLVTHHQDKEARGGGRVYLSHLLGTSIGFALPALIFCYAKTGNLEFSPEGFLSQDIQDPMTVTVLLLLFLFGFAKNGLMPFHSWLPNAMVAPTPVSALLHAVAVVKVGVFCILRVITGVFGVDMMQEYDLGTIVAWIAGFTVIVSSLIALSQNNLKRRLAFSTIGQLSYIILGASILTTHALNGSMMHIAMHAYGKITLFFCAGAIFVATGKKYISQLNGMGRKMPFTFAAFTIGAISVTGLPPTGGMWSKIYLILGAADAGQIAIICVYLVSSVLNAAYFFPIIYSAFFRPPAKEDDKPGLREASPACVIPLCFTALGSLLLFFFPGILLDLANLMTSPPATP